MIYILLITLLVALDQISKFFVLKKLVPIKTYPIIKDVFHLTFAKNTGAAFSIFRDKQLFLIILTTLMIALLIGYFFKVIIQQQNLWLNVSFVLIIGGAIGNLIDRVRFNYVVDFFDFRLINFAIFNMADIFIVCGTILLAVLVIFKKAEL